MYQARAALKISRGAASTVILGRHRVASHFTSDNLRLAEQRIPVSTTLASHRCFLAHAFSTSSGNKSSPSATSRDAAEPVVGAEVAGDSDAYASSSNERPGNYVSTLHRSRDALRANIKRLLHEKRDAVLDEDSLCRLLNDLKKLAIERALVSSSSHFDFRLSFVVIHSYFHVLQFCRRRRVLSRHS